MKQRVISAVVCIAITLAMILLSTWTRVLFFIVLSIMACKEMKDALEKLDYHVVSWPIYAVSIVCSALIAIQKSGYAFPVFLLIMLLLFTQLIMLKNIGVRDVLATFAVCAYPLSPLMVITYIAKSELLWAAVLLNAIMPAVMADTFALFGGKAFGKHKLCPDISPKKTVEGVVGGVVLNILVALLYAWLYVLYCKGACRVHYGYVALLALLAAPVSVLGDLSFSLLKRSVQIKDFGTLIPGHGGMLDRFDSVIFVAPFAYLFAHFLPLVTR